MRRAEETTGGKPSGDEAANGGAAMETLVMSVLAVDTTLALLREQIAVSEPPIALATLMMMLERHCRELRLALRTAGDDPQQRAGVHDLAKLTLTKFQQGGECAVAKDQFAHVQAFYESLRDETAAEGGDGS